MAAAAGAQRAVAGGAQHVRLDRASTLAVGARGFQLAGRVHVYELGANGTAVASSHARLAPSDAASATTEAGDDDSDLEEGPGL